MVFHLFKTKSFDLKKSLSMVVLAGLFAGFLGYTPVKADGPQFNIFPISYDGATNTDLPLIDAKNITQIGQWSTSQADHDNGVNANSGDVIEFSIYYHNGVPDAPENIAHNTIVKAFINPAVGENAATHRVAGWIAADNAAAVSSGDASRGGDMQVVLSSTGHLELVSGSVTLFKNQGSNPETIHLPDTIFAPQGGVNIGDVRGCFEFHGFVNFRMRVVGQPAGNLSIIKQVRNVTKSTAFNDTQVDADPNDIVEFRGVVSAANNPVPNVTVRDVKDARLMQNSSITFNGVNVAADQFFGGGVPLSGPLNPSNDVLIVYQAQVAASSQFTSGTTILANSMFATSGTQSVSDGANVRVTIAQPNPVCAFTWSAPLVSGTNKGLRQVGQAANVQMNLSNFSSNTGFSVVNQHVSGSPTFTSNGNGSFVTNSSGSFSFFDTTIIPSSFVSGDYNVFIQVNGVNVTTCTGFQIQAAAQQGLTIDKLVRNDFVSNATFQDQVDAQASQAVTWKITLTTTTNTNTALTGVTLTDVLPSANKFTFVPGTLNVNGVVQSGDGGLFSANGLTLGTIQPNQSIAVTFQTTVASAPNFSVGCEVLINTASGHFGSTNPADTASVRVCKAAPTKQPGSPGSRPTT